MRCLLDVNVLASLIFPDHALHPRAFNWFRREPDRPWATCATTQSGFLRVACHRLGGSRQDLQTAYTALVQSCRDLNHEFWPVDVDLRLLSDSYKSRILGPNQITDLQLLLLANRHGGCLVTLDSGIQELARGTRYANSLHVI